MARGVGHLNVLMAGVPVGMLEQAASGALTLNYSEKWVAATEVHFPLSRSLPLEGLAFEGRVVENYLWNLLPDNHDTLAAWGRHYEVSPNSPFALLSAVGHDCAGAVQFVTDDWVARNGTGSPGTFEALDDREIAARLRKLREQRTWTGRRSTDPGSFSLPGAQSKMALALTEEGWAVPAGRAPTTHIFKPPLPHVDGTNQNEFLCLRLAGAMGLTAAVPEVMHFEDETAIVVRRYDRIRGNDRRVRRLHQEDMCQALGVHPDRKYQNLDGPGAVDIANKVLAYCERPEEAKWTFVRAMIFNFLIGGTDAHAKNYSIVHYGGRRTVMAPLYDLISYWPYLESGEMRKLKMAMSVAGHYKFDDVCPRHWSTLCDGVGLTGDTVRETLRAMNEEMPDALSDVVASARDEGVDHPVAGQILDMVAARTVRVRRSLDVENVPTPGP